MNNVFDIDRFGNLFAYECRNFLPRIANALITYVCIIFSFWAVMVAAQETMSAWLRSGIISFIFGVACAIGPFIVYYNANNRRKGYYYAMIPASTLEKFISMLILCLLVVPFLSYVALTAADYLLYLVSPQGVFGFKEFILFNPLYSENIYVDGDVVESGSTFFGYLLSVSLSMMYNMVLRSAKIIKAILISMAVVFAIMIAFIIVIVHNIETILELFNDFTASQFLLLYNIVVISLSVLFLWVTYRRIKRVNY